MIISQATKVLSRTCQTVLRSPSTSISQKQSLILVHKRCKQTVPVKRCEENPKKSRKLVTIAGIAVVGTTVAVFAAKNDEDFREWSREHAPILDGIVKVVYKEEETYLEFLARAHKELTNWLKNTLYNAFQGISQTRDTKKDSISLPEVCEESKKPYKLPESAFLVKKDDEEKDVKEDSTPITSSTPSVPIYIKELKDLEDKVGSSAQDTIQTYHAIVCILRDQATLIDNLDQLISKHDCKIWEKLEKKMKDEQKYLDKVESSFKTLEDAAASLRSRLEEDSYLLTDEIKIQAQNNLTILMGDVQRAKEHLEKEKSRMSLPKRSWDKVRQARTYFAEELETLSPKVWLNDEKLNLPLDGLEPFIQNVLNNILFLEKEFCKLQTVRDAEVTSAIEKFKALNDIEGLIVAAVNIEGSKENRLCQEETQKTLLTHKAKCEKTARTMMKQQAEIYSDIKAEALKVKEREVEHKMQRLQDERLAEVRAQHKVEIAKLIGRIQGANEAISQRGDKSKDQQEKQQFWSAAQILLSAVKPIDVFSKPREPKSLKNEIANVSKTAPEGDELVEHVLSSIPLQAIEHGVETETRLRERFITLERESRKVAAMPDGEVTLLQVFLARLQSALYINEPIPLDELNNEPIDVESLNNYEVLFRASHYVDRGEFDQAVKYLNLLKGPCRIVASDWMRDVVVYLETRQAAEVLLAHASATSMQA